MAAKVKIPAVPLSEKLSCSSKVVPFSNPMSHCPTEVAADNMMGNFAVGDSSAISTGTTENLLKSRLG